MKVIKYEHQLTYFSSKLLDFYMGGRDFCVFDIETLGLNAAHNELVLAGIMTVDSDGKCEITQYFLEDLEEEVYMLSVLRDHLNQFDVMLTYNGRHFDVPFIKKRAAALKLYDYDINPYNLDLYLVINGHSQFKYRLENLRQSTIETYMEMDDGREDEISGKESIQLYYDFAGCKDPEKKAEIKEKILLHNHDDIMQLYRILPVIRQTDFHSAMNALGFPVRGENGWPDLYVRIARATPLGLTIAGNYIGKPISYSSFSTPERPFDCAFNIDKNFEFIYKTQKYKDNLFINAKEIFGETSQFEKYGGYANGFIVLSQKNKRNFLEINMMTKELLHKFMSDNPFYIRL